MDRRYTYSGEIPRTEDFAAAQTYALVGLARLAEDLLFSTLDPNDKDTSRTLFAGFKPGFPGALVLTLGVGRVYDVATVDPTEFGDLGTDSRLIVKAYHMDADVLNFAALPGGGHPRIDLVQVRVYQDDTDPGVLLYWNSANPDQPLSGPGGSNVAENLNRKEIAEVSIKVGTASASPVTPDPDDGWLPLYRVARTAVQTDIVLGNVTVDPAATFLAGLLGQHHTGVAGSAPKIDLDTETQGTLPGDRIGDIPADSVTDDNGTDLQTYLDVRRSYRGVVANEAARDDLADVEDTHWVVIIDDGTGNRGLQQWQSSTSEWIPFGGSGGGVGGSDGTLRAKIYDAIEMDEGQTVVVVPESYNIVGKVLQVTRGGLRMIQGVDWNIVDSTSFEFFKDSIEGEMVEIVEFEAVTGTSDPQSTITEFPAGTVSSTDGTDGNGVFTTTFDMLASPAPRLVVGGLTLAPTTHYTFVDDTITILAPHKPRVISGMPEFVMVSYAYDA